MLDRYSGNLDPYVLLSRGQPHFAVGQPYFSRQIGRGQQPEKRRHGYYLGSTKRKPQPVRTLFQDQ